MMPLRGILLHSGFWVAVTNVHFDLHPFAQETTTTSFLCFGVNRKDHKDVYFVKKPESTKQDSVPTIPSNISLRDFFAGCAISGCMNASEEVYKVPERAYIVADMMLAEREKSLKDGKVEK